jgi:diguanylate cyclase (GGDEF)-like protein
MSKVETRRDVLRRTAVQVAIAVSVTLVLSIIMNLVLFGADVERSVPVGYVMVCGLLVGVMASALLAGGLGYRSSLLLQQLNAARNELVRLSQTDQLTGLLNRRGFDEAAIAVLANANQGDRLPAVAFMCDIDRFKSINDKHGHEFGDAVLVQIGRVFRAFSIEHDVLVARHGGEEFVGLLSGATMEQAMQLAEELRKSCAAQLISSGGATAHVTISVGVATSTDRTNLPRIMGFADRALYAAKNNGRNTIATMKVPPVVLAAA